MCVCVGGCMRQNECREVKKGLQKRSCIWALSILKIVLFSIWYDCALIWCSAIVPDRVAKMTKKWQTMKAILILWVLSVTNLTMWAYLWIYIINDDTINTFSTQYIVSNHAIIHGYCLYSGLFGCWLMPSFWLFEQLIDMKTYRTD